MDAIDTAAWQRVPLSSQLVIHVKNAGLPIWPPLFRRPVLYAFVFSSEAKASINSFLL
jgi:hypothetical protein